MPKVERRGSSTLHIRKSGSARARPRQRLVDPLAGRHQEAQAATSRERDSQKNEAVSPERSAMMARIGQKNTRPEISVRRLLHRLGFRFRLHRRDLPGTPDIVFAKRRIALLVHGCFWHRHSGCRFAYMPKSRVEFWG